jgi:nitrite reductase/ring-hydroxylating ferredoxin subunit
MGEAKPPVPHAPGPLRLQGSARMPLRKTQVFSFNRKGYVVEGFVIRLDSGWFGYLNQCQHWPIPLDYGDGDFFDERVDRIRCKSHGATYLPETGECDAGPCQRAKLIRYAVSVEGEDLIVQLTEE